MIRGLNRCYVPWKLCSTCRHFSTISQAELYQTVRACVPPRLSSEYTLGTLNWVKVCTLGRIESPSPLGLCPREHCHSCLVHRPPPPCVLSDTLHLQGVTPTPGGAAIQLELPPVWPQKMAFVRHVQEQVAQRVGPCICSGWAAMTCARPHAAPGFSPSATSTGCEVDAVQVTVTKKKVGLPAAAAGIGKDASGLAHVTNAIAVSSGMCSLAKHGCATCCCPGASPPSASPAPPPRQRRRREEHCRSEPSHGTEWPRCHSRHPRR